MIINVINNTVVYITEGYQPETSDIGFKSITDTSGLFKYRVAFNQGEFQKVINEKVSLPLFTNDVKSVIIKVEVTNLVNDKVTYIESDPYTLRHAYMLDKGLVETFPKVLDKFISEYKAEMKDLIKTYQEELIDIKEKGDLI